MYGIWLAAAAVISFGATALIGKFLVPFLRKVHFGQTIREEGPNWHKKKQGTPTMGGWMFMIGIAAAALIAFTGYYLTGGFQEETQLMFVRVLAGILMAYAYGLVGFLDDYIKVVKKRNLGLTAKQKLLFQFLSAALYLLSLYLAGEKSALWIPFAGEVNLGVFYWILMAVVIVGLVNAVNLTDGIDGLCGSVTFFAAAILMITASFLMAYGAGIFAVCVAGGCMGFLIWNFNPAKVFMGDTGSLFLGGCVCALGFAIGKPILLILFGIWYLVEMFSVVLQVLYFKATHGKRLFKMSPIHHHFEMCGWSEIKICIVFSAITILGGAGAYLLAIFG